MFGNTGHHHPKTKKEKRTMMRLEALSHANTCEERAKAWHLLGRHSEASVLEQAARFIRHFAAEEG